jgi:hypothetical protein
MIFDDKNKRFDLYAAPLTPAGGKTATASGSSSSQLRLRVSPPAGTSPGHLRHYVL